MTQFADFFLHTTSKNMTAKGVVNSCYVREEAGGQHPQALGRCATLGQAALPEGPHCL